MRRLVSLRTAQRSGVSRANRAHESCGSVLAFVPGMFRVISPWPYRVLDINPSIDGYISSTTLEVFF